MHGPLNVKYWNGSFLWIKLQRKSFRDRRGFERTVPPPSKLRHIDEGCDRRVREPYRTCSDTLINVKSRACSGLD